MFNLLMKGENMWKKILVLSFVLVITNSLVGASLGTIEHNPFLISSDNTTIIVVKDNFPKNCSSEIIIFDMLGRKVINFKQNVYSTTPYSVSWNGNNSAGRKVKSGIYLIFMIRKYQDGTKTETDKVKFGVMR